MCEKSKYLFLLIILFMFLTICKKVNQPYTPELVFIVQTIDEILVENFEIGEYEESDIPLIIKLEDYKHGDKIYKGSVKFAKNGWLKIDSILVTEENCFRVDTTGKMGAVTDVIFRIKEISDKYMEGNFLPTGPTLDVLRDFQFKAVSR